MTYGFLLAFGLLAGATSRVGCIAAAFRTLPLVQIYSSENIVSDT
jgi:hypothetical protein